MASSKTEKIVKLAKEKTQEKERLALQAVEELVNEGQKVSFYSIAKQTGLSKTFLYNNDSVRQVIEGAREGIAGEQEPQSPGQSVKPERILDEIARLKSTDPESYEKIRSALLNEHPPTTEHQG